MVTHPVSYFVGLRVLFVHETVFCLLLDDYNNRSAEHPFHFPRS